MIRALARMLVPPVALLLIVAVVWEALVRLLAVPAYLLPGPSRVLATAWLHGGTLVAASLWTAWAAFCGFGLSLLVGVLVAFAFSQSDLVRRSMYPYAIFLQTVPIVAIAPLIIIWLGTGLASVVVVSFIICLFPIITNATTGLLRVDPNLQGNVGNGVMWAMGSRLDIRHLRLRWETGCGSVWV